MVSTVVELLAAALFVFGIALFVASVVSVPAGFVVAGVLLFVLAVFIERPWRKRS